MTYSQNFSSIHQDGQKLWPFLCSGLNQNVWSHPNLLLGCELLESQ